MNCGRVGDVEQKHSELVPSEARCGVSLSQLGANAVRYLDEQLVTHLVAQAVVQDLEPVEVEPEHRVGVVAPALGVGQRLGQAVQEKRSIGQASQAVVEGLLAQALFEEATLSDVGEGADYRALPAGRGPALPGPCTTATGSHRRST